MQRHLRSAIFGVGIGIVAGVLVTAYYGWITPFGLGDHKITATAQPEGRAADSQIQLEGALPVSPASNADLSHWSGQYDEAIERCWRGVTYVIFIAARPIGSVVIMPDGKPLLCDNTTR